MTQEEKDLLLKDLCMRLPYGVNFHYTKHPQSNIDQDFDGTAIGYYCNLIVSANDKDFCLDRCKLYLRPMSSMTEEEMKELKTLCSIYIPTDSPAIGFEEYGIIVFTHHLTDNTYSFKLSVSVIDWLLKNHFDYRGLIPKGLAIEVNESNNPYND